MTDLIAHLTRQGAFGRATFGPGPLTEGFSSTSNPRSKIRQVQPAQEDAA